MDNLFRNADLRRYKRFTSLVKKFNASNMYNQFILNEQQLRHSSKVSAKAV